MDSVLGVFRRVPLCLLHNCILFLALVCALACPLDRFPPRWVASFWLFLIARTLLPLLYLVALS